ncbi:MAG: hypothetical protein ACFB10_22900, partial [Salibacteraceae bacterium]
MHIKMQVILVFLCLMLWGVLCPLCIRAQTPIETLPDGFSNGGFVRDFAHDPKNDLLFISGVFHYSSNGKDLRGLTYYDGIEFHEIQGLVDTCPGICQSIGGIHWYNDTLWISRTYHTISETTYGITKLSGSPGNWTIIDQKNISNGTIIDFTDFRGEIYALGYFTQFFGISSEKIIRKTINGWEAMPSIGLNLVGGDYFSDGFVFNDELYIGGNFNLGQYQSILKWDRQTISPIEDGLRGSISWVTNMASYKGKLYVSGGFWDSSGNPGNNIVVIENGKMKPVGLGLTALPDAHGISQVN